MARYIVNEMTFKAMNIAGIIVETIILSYIILDIGFDFKTIHV